MMPQLGDSERARYEQRILELESEVERLLASSSVSRIDSILSHLVDRVAEMEIHLADHHEEFKTVWQALRGHGGVEVKGD